MNDFRDYSSYTSVYNGQIPDYTDYLCHHGILGMHWGIRRYQNKDGSLTAVGKQHYKQQKKDFLKAVNRYNSTPNYQDKNSIARENLFNNEYVKDSSKKVKDAGKKRDEIGSEMRDLLVNGRKDFNGATNLIRNDVNNRTDGSGIKNLDINRYSKGVQEYYKLLDQYAKDQGWNNINEKAKNQGLGNEDDLFEEVFSETKDYKDYRSRYEEANREYVSQATTLAKEMLKESGVKTPTDRQVQTTIYALTAAYKNK